MKKQLPNLMPAHKSKKITVAQARKAILKVEAEMGLRPAAERKESAKAEPARAEG